jgi:hypothetical protein
LTSGPIDGRVVLFEPIETQQDQVRHGNDAEFDIMGMDFELRDDLVG